jgi:DNA mismatch repair protein MutS2
MNWSIIADEATARALDLPWLAEALRPSSSCGARAFARWEPFRRGRESDAAERARRVHAVATRAGDDEVRAATEWLRVIPNVTGSAARAALGEVLPDDALLQIARFSDGAVRLADRLAGSVLRELADLDAIGSQGVRELAARLARGRTAGGGFYLDDSFDPALHAARAELGRLQHSVDELEDVARGRVAIALGRTIVETDEFIVMRDAAPAAWPGGVAIVREASTYFLCALMPDETLQHARASRDGAAAAVAVAEASIRADVSGAIAHAVAELTSACDAVGAFDIAHAAVRFTRTYGCNPADVESGVGIRVEGARFLPLQEVLERRGLRFSPFDVDVRSAAVVTGPNMGGKTVVLRTCGAIAVFASFGLPVPAQRATVELFEHVVWLSSGDEAGSSLLSSFAHEVVRLRDAVASSAGALVLLDEFARTTGPREGAALLASLLAFFNDRGVRALATTHLDGIAAAARVEHLTVGRLRALPHRAVADLREALALIEGAMDYSVRKAATGDAASGDALDLAELLGLDAAVIDGARRRLE